MASHDGGAGNPGIQGTIGSCSVRSELTGWWS
jgi:hypothetical protein